MKKILLILCFTIFCILSFAQQQGSFKDTRDGKTYKTVKIGNQIWFAENLAYTPINGVYWIYNNEQINLTNYGYLYNLETAKNSCPTGWHLPSKNEFALLLSKYSQKENLIENGISGFAAKYAGWIDGNNKFDYIGIDAFFWSSDIDGAGLHISDYDIQVNGYYRTKGLSVRCLKD